MGKYTIQHLADILVKKNGLADNEAQNFVNGIFEVIKEGLETDKLVKIKGFGTFKIIDVDPRESVNVNTGERVLIEGHQKVTFTPDSTMKEMVNRPFSQFDTVILKDGVDFSGIDITIDNNNTQDTEEDNLIAEEEVAVSVDNKAEGKNVEEKSVEEKTVEEKAESEKTEEPSDAETPLEQETEFSLPQEKENNAVAEPTDANEHSECENKTEKETTTEETTTEEDSRSYTSFYIYVAVCIILMVASAYGGYMFGLEDGRHQETSSQIAKYSEYLDKQTAEIRAQRIANEAYIAKDTTKAVKETKQSDHTTTKKAKDDFSKYNEADPRVRTGAYVIVGIEKDVTAREGQTVASISNSLLGPGMSCYIEVLNGVKADQPLKEGTVIKIPKLIHKKAAKKLAK